MDKSGKFLWGILQDIKLYQADPSAFKVVGEREGREWGWRVNHGHLAKKTINYSSFKGGN